MITIDELKAKLGGMKTAVDDLRDALSIEASEKRLAELEHQMTMPGFYDDQARSQKVISEMGEVKNKLERFGKLSTQYEEAETLLLMIEEENDPSLAAEGEEAVNGVEKSIDELQLMTMLNGEYDHNNAILTFHAGTGGTEAQDWAEMLYRMYTRWAEALGYSVWCASARLTPTPAARPASPALRSCPSWTTTSTLKSTPPTSRCRSTAPPAQAASTSTRRPPPSA